MIQIFYSIFDNNDNLLFANNTQYNTRKEAIKALQQLHNKIKAQKNIKITEYTSDTLSFTDIPTNEYETEEYHKFQII